MNGDSIASTSSSMQDIAEGEEDVTLSVLLQRTLKTSDNLLETGDFSSPTAQASLQSTLSSLSLCASLISHLALLSSNETISELSTSTLRCFLVSYYTGMLELQRRTKDYKQRMEVLETAEKSLKGYSRSCEEYEVVPSDKRKRLFMLNNAGAANDQARRREAKIAQYKEEKAIKGQLEALQARISSRPANSISAGSVNSSAEDIEDEYLRPLLLLQIELHYLKAFNELNSVSQELELLSTMPNMSELPSRNAITAQDPRERARDEQDASWRLDSVQSSSSKRQLIDSSGRVLQPFTILPSASTSSTSSLDTRLRLQSQVFGNSHRLPTMSVDEYLDMEYERGNILQGGGAKNTEEANLEGEAKRAWEEEEDNADGYARQEDGLQKKREWDAYKDDHKKGEGNRMNRG